MMRVIERIYSQKQYLGRILEWCECKACIFPVILNGISTNSSSSAYKWKFRSDICLCLLRHLNVIDHFPTKKIVP